MSTFADLGVSEAVTGALSKRGIEQPFAVQSMVVPDVLDGVDVWVPDWNTVLTELDADVAAYQKATGS